MREGNAVKQKKPSADDAPVALLAYVNLLLQGKRKAAIVAAIWVW